MVPILIFRKQLHESNAALDQPPRDQATGTELLRRWIIEAVERVRGFGFSMNIERLAGGRLHSCGELKIGDPRCELVLERSRLAEDLFLLLGDQLDVTLIEHAVRHDRLGEDALRLTRRESQRRADDLLPGLALEPGARARRVQEVLHDGDQVVEFRRRQIEHHRVVAELLGNLAHRHGHEEALLRVLEPLDEVAELADDPRLVVPALMEVA